AVAIARLAPPRAIARVHLHATLVLRDEHVRTQRRERLKIGPLVTIVVTRGAWRQHLDDDHRVRGGLMVVRRMFGRSADDRAVGVPSAAAPRDPESLVG